MKQSDWYMMFSVCSKLYNRYCHLNIKENAVTAKGLKVGEWIDYQRHNIENLSNSQINDLISIGMIWTDEIGTFHDEFDKYRDELTKYSAINTLGIRAEGMILKLDEQSIAPDGFNLYEWSLKFDELRRKYDDRFMTVAEIAYLTELGFKWEDGTETRQDIAKHRSVSLSLIAVEISQSQSKGLNDNSNNIEIVKKGNPDNGLTSLKMISKYLEDTRLELDNLFLLVDDTKLLVGVSERLDSLIMQWNSVVNTLSINGARTGSVAFKVLQNKTFNKHCTHLYNVVDRKAQLLGISRDKVVLTNRDYKEFDGSLSTYQWTFKMHKCYKSLSDEEIHDIELAYPLWFESTNGKQEQSCDSNEEGLNDLDSIIDAYVVEAKKYLEKDGYIPYSDKDCMTLYNLGLLLERINYNDFSKEQIEKLESVEFIWVEEGLDKVTYKFLKTVENVVKYIVERNKTEIGYTDNLSGGGAIYSSYKGVLQKVKSGSLIAKRGLNIINKHLESNK